jgi:hypothetical protein
MPETLSTLIERTQHVHDYDPYETFRKEQEKTYG